jgi:hypothetical protein
VVVAERAAAALGQVEQAAPLAPLAPLAARGAARAATALFNPLMAKAVRLEILLLNLPVARARIASIPQGRELDREALVRALKLQRENVMRERAASGRRFANACPHAQRRSPELDAATMRGAATPAASSRDCGTRNRSRS